MTDQPTVTSNTSIPAGVAFALFVIIILIAERTVISCALYWCVVDDEHQCEHCRQTEEIWCTRNHSHQEDLPYYRYAFFFVNCAKGAIEGYDFFFG